VELLVGKMDKSPCFTKLLLDGLVPDAFSFDVDRQAFGYKAHFTMKSFGQHAAVAFDLFEPFIYFIEPAGYPLEPLIQPMNKPMKTFIQVLNKFLIHTASAAV